MSKLKTTVEVSRIESGKMAIMDQIVVGELTPNKVIRTEGIEVGFRYTKENGESLDGGSKIYSWSEVNTLWDLIKVNAPNTTFEDLINYGFNEAFKIEMSNTFNINVNQLEEIN